MLGRENAPRSTYYMRSGGCHARTSATLRSASSIFDSTRLSWRTASMQASQEGWDVSIGRPTVGDQLVIPGRRINSGD